MGNVLAGRPGPAISMGRMDLWEGVERAGIDCAEGSLKYFKDGGRQLGGTEV